MGESSDNDAFFDDDLPAFAPGALVRHRRYDYRGVVVDFDMSCGASDEWYNRNRSQPERDQPWYHVLVDGSDMITYAAQTSLMAEEAPAPIAHPLIAFFFWVWRGTIRPERSELAGVAAPAPGVRER